MICAGAGCGFASRPERQQREAGEANQGEAQMLLQCAGTYR